LIVLARAASIRMSRRPPSGTVLKYREDVDRVRATGLAALIGG